MAGGMFKIVLIGTILVGFCGSMPHKEETEVILTHVIFRHGERTTYKFYPNDPNINNTFFPIGMGGLTNKGKKGEFNLGKFLRKEYDNLLGKYYYEGLIEARSTDTVRTIQSAQLVLAGLFPPVNEQIWNTELNWQPIPVFYRTKPNEDILHPECERKLFLMNSLPERPEIQNIYIKPFEKLFTYIEEHSGMKIRNVHDLVEFYFIVNTESDLNQTVPDWVHEIYPEPLYQTSSLIYSYSNFDPELKKINSGYLLKKILDDSMAKINSEEKYKNIKMFLYSGHETTIGYLLHALRVLKSHIPPYSSALMIELHKDQKNNHYIKLRYKDSTHGTKSKDLTIPGCATLCPIQQFIGLQKRLLPTISIHEACKMI